MTALLVNNDCSSSRSSTPSTSAATTTTTSPTTTNTKHSHNNPPTNTNYKTIYFIRHAESLENVRHQSIHRVLADLKSASLPDPHDVVSVVDLLDFPAQVDTPVTGRGKRQIRNVAQQLEDDHFLETSQIRLVVHSPLQRAQETAEGLLHCRADTCRRAATVHRVVQLEALRERTPDEIFIPWRKAAYTARRHEFLCWLQAQPESVIGVVGHSEYFRALLHLPFKFGHCHVWKAEFRPHTRQKFFGLERLYRPQLLETTTSSSSTSGSDLLLTTKSMDDAVNDSDDDTYDDEDYSESIEVGHFVDGDSKHTHEEESFVMIYNNNKENESK